MTSISQHFPNFVEGVEPRADEFQTIAELLAIPWVAQWANETDGQPFHRFSQSDECLMAEYDHGYMWWVVGHLSGPVDLPVWEPRYRMAQRNT